MKVIIAGGRDMTSVSKVALAVELSGFQITEVVCGMAWGADLAGKAWADRKMLPVKEMPADWDNINVPGALIKYRKGKPYNARAGFARNQAMADYADALIALWDHVSPGTTDMIERARIKGIPIYVYRYKAQEL